MKLAIWHAAPLLALGVAVTAIVAWKAPGGQVVRLKAGGGPGPDDGRFSARLRQNAVTMREARDAVARGELGKAESLLRREIEIDPQLPYAWLGLAEVSEREGKSAEALQAYQTLVYAREHWSGSIGSDPITHMRCVLLLLGKRRWSDAVAVYGKAMHQTAITSGHPALNLRFDALRPQWDLLAAAAHYYLGSHRSSWGSVLRTETFPELQAAKLAHLETAVGLEPEWAVAQHAYGRALAAAGRDEEAKKAFRLAIDLANGDSGLKAEAQLDLNRAMLRFPHRTAVIQDPNP